MGEEIKKLVCIELALTAALSSAIRNNPIAKVNKHNLPMDLVELASKIIFISYVSVEIQIFNKNNTNKHIIIEANMAKIQVSLPPRDINIEE